VVTLGRPVPSYGHEAEPVPGGAVVRSLYASVLAVHVIVAILGLGSIASVALVASAARRAGRGLTDVLPWLGPLLRASGISLGIMLITGVLLDVVVGGTFHERWWFRGSALLLIVTGVLHGLARRTVRRPLPTAEDRDAALRRVERIAYGMCALIAAITVLMEVKPFR
jgi:hypothetical protein